MCACSCMFVFAGLRVVLCRYYTVGGKEKRCCVSLHVCA